MNEKIEQIKMIIGLIDQLITDSEPENYFLLDSIDSLNEYIYLTCKNENL